MTTARHDRSLAAGEVLILRLGGEHFALDLACAEEVLELPPLERLPETPAAMLGAATVRGGLLPVYTPEAALRVSRANSNGVLVVVRCGECRVGLAGDDVEDVMSIEPSMVRHAPVPDGGTVLRGVARRGSDLVGILDAEALLSACASATCTEAS